MTTDKPDLHAAYALETPEDNKRLYAAWADTYDQTFAQAMDFVLPRQVARLFHQAGGGDPVLDAGAGTGLLAEAILRHGSRTIDAFDLSFEMLAVAEAKGLYRDVVQGDLLGELPFQPESYGAVVSSGTFTHGHVGPEAIDGLLTVARPGALFALTIKAEHYQARGFASRFESYGRLITGVDLHEVPIYGADAKHENAGDVGLVAVFRKAGR